MKKKLRIQIYNAEYYQKNKEILKQKKLQKGYTVCHVCGDKIVPQHRFYKHIQTVRHKWFADCFLDN